MSIQSPRNERAESTAGYLLSLPFVAFSGACTLVRSAFGRAKSTDEAGPVVIPTVTPVCQYEIASRAYSHYFGSTKVCFYHYPAKGIIRAVARKGSCAKELDFTSSLADRYNVPFNMDGAIAFIRAHGFKEAKIVGTKRDQPGGQVAVASTPIDDPPAQSKTERPRPQSKQRSPLKSTSVPNKDRPFTGRVTYAGETTRSGRDGGPDFTTFMVKLQSETGNFEREFIGEHLAELVETHSVKEGNLVRLQRLGRNRFEVMVNGETEERWRNEYALTVLE